MARPKLTRAQILAHRLATLGLERTGPVAERLHGVLDLGLQDTPYGTATDALAARGAELREGTGPKELVRVWSRRGAPYFHRPADLKTLCAALWPLDEDDATQRIGRQQIGSHAERGLEAFTEAASAMRAAVKGRMSKGDVSRAVSDAVSDDLNYDCGGCGARHITGGLFQLVGLATGLRVVVDGRTTYLEPLPAKIRPGIPKKAKGTTDDISRYLAVMGPVSVPAMSSILLSAPARSVTPVLPDVVEVDTPAGRAVVPAGLLEELQERDGDTVPDLVRLLPANDPWLQVRDRDRAVIVPEKTHHKAVWRILGNPGIVLVNGDVAGIWRAKNGRKGALAVTVEPFHKLTKAVRSTLDEEAGRLAGGRGVDAVDLTVAGA